MSMRSWIRNVFARPVIRTIRKAPRRVRLGVEALEDRRVPATFTVTSSLDNHSAGTLRWAIDQANVASEATTIVFDNVDTITLNGSLRTPGDGQNSLYLTNTNFPISILGPSPTDPVYVQGDPSSFGNHVNHVFWINQGVQGSFENLVISTGTSDSPLNGGGGMQNRGTVNLTNCTFSENVAPWGGALENWGTATLTSCTFTGNQVEHGGRDNMGNGGAILNQAPWSIYPCRLILNNCVISDNYSATSGGGLYNAGVATLSGCSIENNKSTYGGGLYNHSSGTPELIACTVSGNSASNSGGGLYSVGRTTLQNSTFERNTSGEGGGLFNNGYAVLTSCTISLNNSSYGGGLYSMSGVVLSNTAISGNTASVSGGGLYMSSSGEAALTNCTVSGNTASGNGGGLLNDGILSLTNSTVSYNRSNGDAGGGLWNDGTANLTNSTVSFNVSNGTGAGLWNSWTLNLTNCTVSNNATTSLDGGGLWNSGTANLTNSTVYSNGTPGNGGGIYNDGHLTLVSCTFVNNIGGTANSYGGGLYNTWNAWGTSTATLQNCTFSQNQASYGGGLYNVKGGALSLINTIVAGNHAYNGDNAWNGGNDVGGGSDFSYAVDSKGYNLIGDTDNSNTSWASTDLTGTGSNPLDPMLQPLGNYGGPTLTMALKAGSPAIHKGTLVPGVATDQRGLPLDSPPDIGAFQTQPHLQVSTTVGVLDPGTATWYLKNTNQAGAPDILPFQYGAPTWTPLTGDWDGNGTDTPGVFDPTTATWYLRNSNSAGAPDITPFAYGMAGWIPVVGDWDGNGTVTIGVVDPLTLTWYLKNSNGPGAWDISFRYGQAGDVPVVGDWDGDGVTTIGVWRPGTATWYLKDSNTPGAPDVSPFAYGQAGDVPVAGDWNADGATTVGVFRPGTASWFLRNSNTPGAPDIGPFAYGGTNWLPVTSSYGRADLLRAGDGAQAADPQTPLTQADLDGVVAAALTRLQAAGVGGALLGQLSAAHFQVSDLPAGNLGMGFPGANQVLIDPDAAGHGWFVDPTPLQDEEFTPAPSGALLASAGTAAEDRMDLLTAVLHELGHLAGLPDVSAAADPGNLMGDVLGLSNRLTAALDRVFAQSHR
jgi:parallel beta-helix repeat protein